MSEQRSRCAWSVKSELETTYHDEEWGVPVHDDHALFAKLLLDGMQAGLSWAIVLQKREAILDAFHDFDPGKLAKLTDTDLETLRTNPKIIRNRAKIRGARQNGQAYLTHFSKSGSFSAHLWGFVGGQTQDNAIKAWKETPATSEASTAMSKDLKARGFTFVGPTICYAFMQAVGMVNDHEVSCFRYAELKAQ